MYWLLLPVALLFSVVAWLTYVVILTRHNARACLVPAPPVSGSGPTRFTDLQAVLDAYSAGHAGVGLQATLVLPDGDSWTGVSGYASHEQAVPLTPQHHLYIGSLTKLLTAALVVRQVEAGAFGLDSTLEPWFDSPWASRVSVADLLNHTSGIPSYTEEAWFLVRYFGLPQKTWLPAELAAGIANRPLEFEPGSRHRYSNSNYLLLGLLLEKSTGKSYAEFIADPVRSEWGLSETYYLAPLSGLGIANAYDETLLHLGRANLSGFRRSLESGGYSAGGVLSNSQDMARFVRALFEAKIVSRPSLARMLTFIDAPDADVPAQTGYGLGLRRLEVGGNIFAGHTGTIPGYSGIAMQHVADGATIVVLSNLSTIDQVKLLEALFFELEPQARKP
ncbi:MAG: serine hydrolase domain-containing protein [Chloroflexota bacterium]